ncbi:MAG: hypothetical protein R3C97_05445 [Geminicoccaceae bacterium]
MAGWSTIMPAAGRPKFASTMISVMARRLAATIQRDHRRHGCAAPRRSPGTSERVTLVYRRCRLTDIVQGAMQTWLRIHAPGHELAHEELSHISGTHVHFRLRGPDNLRRKPGSLAPSVPTRTTARRTQLN